MACGGVLWCVVVVVGCGVWWGAGGVLVGCWWGAGEVLVGMARI